MLADLLLMSSAGVSAIIDSVALIIVFAFLIVGVIRGFVKTFVSIFGKIFSLLFAVLLCSSMAKFLNNSFGLIDTIGEWLTNVVTRIFGDTVANTTLGEISNSKIEDLTLSTWIIKIIINAKEAGEIPLDTTLNQIISPALAYYIVSIISIILLYIIFRVIFFIIGDIVSKMHNINLIGKVDKILGAVLGFVWGVIVVQICVFVINVIPIGFVQDLAIAIDKAPITNFIDKINLFGLIIDAMSSKDVISVIRGFVAK